MTILTISLIISTSILVILCIGLIYYLYKQNDYRHINFVELSKSNGDYGVVTIESVYSSYIYYFVEFKVIHKAMNGNKTLLNIKVTNVKEKDPRDVDDSNHEKSVKALYDTQWINENGIYWFSDNEMNRRDKVISKLLEKEK